MKDKIENDKKNEENSINNEKSALLNGKNKVQYVSEKNDEYDKERLKHSKNFYEDQDLEQRQKFEQQRHLYDHKKEKRDPLISIYSKHLQEEYISEVNYILRNSIITIILSLIIILHDFLILKNFKSYDENVISLIFSSFSFFISILLIIELYRNALLDQIRYTLHKLFSLFLSLFLLCIFVSQSINSFIVYNKIKEKKEKCKTKKIGCGNTLLFNIILILNGLYFCVALFLIKFQMWLGFNSIKVLFGCELEVFQKQILEDKKSKKDDIKDNKIDEKEKSHPKQD